MLQKVRSLEFRVFTMSAGVVTVSVVAVVITVWGVLRVLHNESFLPFTSNASQSSAYNNSAPSSLPAGNDNQALQADLNVLQSELAQSGANINSAKAAVNSQNTGN